LAYLDDITILADTVDAGERATAVIAERVGALGMAVNVRKCECLLADAAPDPPRGSMLAAFRRVPTLKLLGASISHEDAREADHLFARERDKATTLFARLRLGASPQFFALLRSCAIPKLAHAVRTHSSAVSGRLCQIFDARVEDLIAYWATAGVAARQRLIMGLPRAMGGMGLTRMELIAPAAFYASSSTALSGARRLQNQAALCALVYRDELDRAERDFHFDVDQISRSASGQAVTGVGGISGRWSDGDRD
jgi:hypothetical protein